MGAPPKGKVNLLGPTNLHLPSPAALSCVGTKRAKYSRRNEAINHHFARVAGYGIWGCVTPLASETTSDPALNRCESCAFGPFLLPLRPVILCGNRQAPSKRARERAGRKRESLKRLLRPSKLVLLPRHNPQRFYCFLSPFFYPLPFCDTTIDA